MHRPVPLESQLLAAGYITSRYGGASSPLFLSKNKPKTRRVTKAKHQPCDDNGKEEDEGRDEECIHSQSSGGSECNSSYGLGETERLKKEKKGKSPSKRRDVAVETGGVEEGRGDRQSKTRPTAPLQLHVERNEEV